MQTGFSTIYSVAMQRKRNDWAGYKARPLYELVVYVVPCADNLTEEKSRESMFEFPTGVWIPEYVGNRI